MPWYSLGGGVLGSILFNELFPFIKSLYKLSMSTQNSFGISGVAFIYKSLGLPKVIFVLLFVIVAVSSFWGAEYLEKNKGDGKESGEFFKTPFLKMFSVTFIISAIICVFISTDSKTNQLSIIDDKAYLKSIASGDDHISSKKFAKLIFMEDKDTIVVDVRPSFQFKRFHLRDSVNVELPELPNFVRKHKYKKRIILYSNGMTHPAQARDILYKMGYQNVFILTDGLNGFIKKIIKPVSVREKHLSEEDTRQINEWSNFFK